MSEQESGSQPVSGDREITIVRNEKKQFLAALESSALLVSKALPERRYLNANPAGIYIGLRMAFSEACGDPRTEAGKEKLDELYSMVDYINAYNSVVDDAEGIRRVLQSKPETPHRDILEAAVEGIVSNWQGKKKRMISLFESHGRKEEAEATAAVFEGDLHALVVEGNQDIKTYSEEMCIERREYDNAIFELACAVTLYGVNNFQTEYGDGGTSLQERYGWLIDESQPTEPMRRWVKALHKTYITFGVFDDLQGIEDDLKLGLITYPAFLSEVRGLSKDEIREEIGKLVTRYNQKAEALGMSNFLRKVFGKAVPLFDKFIIRKRESWSKERLSLEELRRGGVDYIREKLSVQGCLD